MTTPRGRGCECGSHRDSYDKDTIPGGLRGEFESTNVEIAHLLNRGVPADMIHVREGSTNYDCRWEDVDVY